VLTGGQIPPGPGWFYPPTVVVGADRGTDLHEVETFGPVVSVCVVDAFEDGVREAASSHYALGATLLTASAENAALAETIPSALVWVNEWRGGAAGAVCEPARASGQGALGTLDGVTRPFVVHRAPLPQDGASAGGRTSGDGKVGL
jgi:succinate-semialdehyde dehydrogenase/glutarate-semialdehyde dehydrogenase